MRSLNLDASGYLAFPLYPLYNVPRVHAATVAQLAEQAFRKRQVKGSNPFGGSTTIEHCATAVLPSCGRICLFCSTLSLRKIAKRSLKPF